MSRLSGRVTTEHASSARSSGFVRSEGLLSPMHRKESHVHVWRLGPVQQGIVASRAVLPCTRHEVVAMTLKYRMFTFGVGAEASCPRCGWRVTATDPDLVDSLRLDAQDHERECHMRNVNSR